jgi:hypothetical protein
MSSSITPRRSGLLLTLILSALAVTALGCGGSSKSATTKQASTPAAPATSAATTVPPGQDNLTGTWSGHQTGAYNGTLSISWQESNWKQSGPGTSHAQLQGTIKLPAPAGTESVSGTWHTECANPPCNGPGDPIAFRTVSGAPILYTGSYNSGHMSGSYRAAKGHGSWNATQSGQP